MTPERFRRIDMLLTSHGGSIKGYFKEDNFRRTTGHNMYDPESLITGKELTEGLDYDNSSRDYPSQDIYDKIVTGEIPAKLVPAIAPRILITRGY